MAGMKGVESPDEQWVALLRACVRCRWLSSSDCWMDGGVVCARGRNDQFEDIVILAPFRHAGCGSCAVIGCGLTGT